MGNSNSLNNHPGSTLDVASNHLYCRRPKYQICYQAPSHTLDRTQIHAITCEPIAHAARRLWFTFVQADVRSGPFLLYLAIDEFALLSACNIQPSHADPG